MGDEEYSLPQSKKRAAGREISRDNPGLDDDEDAAEEETGTFKRASDEVLAARRIVKVRRQQTSSTPSTNPFAGIRLVPPSNDSVIPPTEITSEKQPEVTSETQVETEKTVSESEVEVKSDKLEAESAANEVKNTETEEKKDNGVENADPNAETTHFGSFQGLSSNQNAFTGLAGTGFSTTSFSFGSISKDGPGPSLFGLKNDQPTFGLGLSSNGNSSVFGTTGTSTVTVETGEENEKSVFTADSVLFEFLDGGWKERGKGELKVNVSSNGAEKARLVMRARGNYRLILNASLYVDMKFTNMEKRGVTFACVNSNGEGKEGLSTFALKFKDGSVVEDFRGVVAAHRGKTGIVLKTPENSPKASDD